MKISEKIVKAINQLSQPLKYDYGNPYLIIKVEPEDKALIAFILMLASRQMDGHYSEIDTGISCSYSDYKLNGPDDEIKLIFNYKYFRDGSDFQTYLTPLILSINMLIEKISLGWVQEESFIDGEVQYENKNISGTHYVFLLRQIVQHLTGGNEILVPIWENRPNIIRGKPELVKEFIGTLFSEATIKLAMNNTTPQSQFNLKNNSAGLSLSITNAKIEQGINIKLSSTHGRITFTHELTSQNQANANHKNSTPSAAPQFQAIHQGFAFFNPEKLGFPLYPEEGMDFLFNKLGSKIQVNQLNKLSFIVPMDPSITIKVTQEGGSQCYHLLLNSQKIAVTGSGKTTIYLGIMMEQLSKVEDIDFDFSEPRLGGMD